MKNKSIYSLILALFFINGFNKIYGQEISKEKAFFYFMKEYNLMPRTKTFTYQMEQNACGVNYLEYFANVFDHANFNQKKNDEFEKNKYFQTLTSRILDGIRNVNFANKYTFTTRAELGEYSFANRSFPIYFTLKGFWPFYYDNNCFLMVYIESIVNNDYFNWFLNLSEDQAKTFIARRKSGNGSINRTIYLKFTYSIIDQQASHENIATNLLGSNLDAYVYSIDILENEGAVQKLGTITPSIDYEDKIHGIKIKNGAETTYYKDGYNGVWRPCSKDEAKYYRIINYVDGKINGTVKDYFISGALQMEGTYNGYYAKDGSGNGLFTWYYENGQKSVEVNYTNGKQSGHYTAWYSSGAKKEEVDYLDGKKNGCDYMWDERGNATTSKGTLWEFFTFYNNGNEELYNRDCPFVTIAEKERNDNLPKHEITHPTNGEEKIYYDRYWKVCEENNAKFYRIINYVDGKISGTVKDYWIDGQIQMEGTYLPDCANKGCENGLFTFYYERDWGKDLKKQQCTIIRGKKVGIIKFWTIYGNETERQAENGQ